MFRYRLMSILMVYACFCSSLHIHDTDIVAFTASPGQHSIQMFFKNENGKIFGNIAALKQQLESKGIPLEFATNGGMFMSNFAPVGLYIENYQQISKLKTGSGSGNFNLKPNGVFYISSNGKGNICTTENFVSSGKVKYATQSGPMLLIDGKIHPAFKKGSANLHIRNGVGILPDGSVLFAMSKEEINFYDFAEFFLKAGCKDALYMDGFVCKTYCPEQNWQQLDGQLGVIIAVTKAK